MMVRSYPNDLRQQIVDAIAGGSSSNAAAKKLGVSGSTAALYWRRWQQTGSVAPSRHPGSSLRGKLLPYHERIIAKVKAQPDIKMVDLALWLFEETGVKFDPSALSCFLNRAGFKYKRISYNSGIWELAS